MPIGLSSIEFKVDATITWAAGGWIVHILEVNPNNVRDEDGDERFEFMPHVFTDDEQLLNHLRKGMEAIRKNELKNTFGHDTDPGTDPIKVRP